MAYTKQTWQDEVLNGPERYHISAQGTNLEDATIALTTPIAQAGTPVTAERMNHIEEGIANNREFSMRCLTENYYQTNAKNIDEITDSFCLISGNVTNSGPLFALLNDQSWHAYLENKFFEVKSASGKREQIATGYFDGAKASRVYRWDNTWSEWKLFYRAVNFDTGWIDMTLANGWVRTDGGVAKFRRHHEIIYVIGEIHGGAATSPAFIQLPSGFRPSARTQFTCLRDDSAPVGGSIMADGIMWFATTTYGSKINFSGSWIGEL